MQSQVIHRHSTSTAGPDDACTDFACRPSPEEIVDRLLGDSQQPVRPPQHNSWVDVSAAPQSTAPLNSGRHDAIKEQMRWHWRLVEKIVKHCHKNDVPLMQIKGEIKFFGKAIQYGKKIGILTPEDAERYARRNDRGNAAKHFRGRWLDIEKDLVQPSGAPVSSGMPDMLLPGIETVDRQVRHHMDLVRLCQEAGLKDSVRVGKAPTTFENFNKTIRLAAKHNVITAERKEELMAIHMEGNRWKHEDLPGYASQVPMSGVEAGQVTLEVVVEEPGSELELLGPPPPYMQRQLERADMLEEPL